MARHLSTHPFDERVLSLSYMQMHVFLELRHPVTDDDITSAALKADQEKLDGEETYYRGELDAVEDEATPADDLAFVSEMQ